MTTNELDGMSLYLHTVRQVPLLSTEEEARLLAKLARHRTDAVQTRNRLVAGLQGLIIHLAQRYAHRCQILEVMDLVQEGNLGLMAAIERWQQSGESEFRTYAYVWMRGAMVRAILQQERIIRVPVRTLDAIQRLDRCQERLTSDLGREVTDVEVATALHLAVERVRELRVIQAQHAESLHLLLDEDSEETLADRIADPATMERDASLTTLRELPMRQQVLMWLRYDISDGQMRTQAEVAQLLKMSPKLVGVVERQIRLRLRKLLLAAEAGATTA